MVLGDYDLSKFEGREQVRAVTRIKVHPGWTEDLANGYNFVFVNSAMFYHFHVMCLYRVFNSLQI